MKEYGLQYEQMATLHLDSPKDNSKLKDTDKTT